MKSLLSLIALGLFGFNTGTRPDSSSISLEISSEISIVGKSNLQDFTCSTSESYECQTVTINYSNNGDIIRLDKTILEIDLNSFDCGNPFVNRDFAELLKIDTHSNLKIHLNQISSIEEEQDTLSGIVDFNLEIAGINNGYEMKVYGVIADDSGIIAGALTISLSDYCLVPPKRLLGLVKISDEIQIEFKYRLHNTNQVINQNQVISQTKISK